MRVLFALALAMITLAGAASAQQPAARVSCTQAMQKCISGCPQGARGNQCPVLCSQTKDHCLQTGDWISPFSNSTVVAHNLVRE
jgi:hypothetical protein